VAVGATPVAITDCLNFGSPERPEIAYQIEQSVLGLADACTALGTPVVSGNASLYNETPAGAVLPTPTVGMLGVIEDVERALTIAPKPGDTLVLLGAELAQPAGALAGSEYLALQQGKVAGRPAINLDLEARVQRLVLDAHARWLLTSAHDCADGGLAVAAAECCIAAGAGIEPGSLDLGGRLDAALFGEAQSRFLVGVAEEQDLEALQRMASERGVRCDVLGVVGGERFALGPVDAGMAELTTAYETGLGRILGGTTVDPDVVRRS
jgi:phosphoribosylformylglycinamidine synthase